MTTQDIIKHYETERRSLALVTRAVATVGTLVDIDTPAQTFRARGQGDLYTKQLLSDEANIDLIPLQSAFIDTVRERGIESKLDVLRIPLQRDARVFLGGAEADIVEEAAEKPLSDVTFDIGGPPAKVAATIIVSREALRAVGAEIQAAILRHLSSAVARRSDQFLLDAFAAAAPSALGTVGGLLGAISGGNPARPAVIGSFATLLGMGTLLTELAALGVPVIASAAAGNRLIVIDQDGIAISDVDIVVEVARHADITTVGNLWQRNMVGLRAERFVRVIVRDGAVAWADMGSPA